MFLGWFDVDADAEQLAQAIGVAPGGGDGARVLRQEAAGLVVRPCPAASLIAVTDTGFTFLEGSPWWVRGSVEEPVDSEQRLAEYAGACTGGTAFDLGRELGGGFAIASFEASPRRLRIATDRFCQRPVYHARHGSGVVFGSDPAAVASFPGRQARIDLQSIFDYFHFHVIPGPRTAFQDVERLEPGTMASFQAGRSEVRRYWQPSFEEHGRRGERGPAEARIRELMQQAVQRSVGSEQRVGAFLSGGIDSSTVAGNLARVVDGPARAFSIGFDVDGYDETGFARTAASAFGLQHVEYNLQPADIVEVLPRLAGIYGQPFGNASAVPTYFCARLARSHGVDLLLGGDGGDELFGGNQRYAFQWLLGLYDRVPSALARSVLEPALLGPDIIQRIPVLKKLRSYVAQARVPLPQRMEGANLLTQLGVQEFFTPDFLTEISPRHPQRVQSEIFDGVSASLDLNRILGFDFKLTLADNDLPKVRGMSEAAGVGVHFPFLDPDVVDFSLALPVSEKLYGTRLRPFFKRAMRGFLPEAILSKAKHGFGLPYGPWLKSHAPLRELSFDALASMKGRGIVSSAMIDALAGPRLHEHASYYGSAIWLIVVLELWMAAWEEARLTA